ncbi:signal peptidase I [Candidatus Gottesmanbacteria bacterium]|nr:signal peptidase I [Candidatus Gottesmanbacteria bacterium]
MNIKNTKNPSGIVSLFLSLFRIVFTVALILFFVRPFVPLIEELIPVTLRRYGFEGEDIKIAGTGSMYPTFPKGTGASDIARAKEIVAFSSMKRYPSGIELFGKRYFGYVLKHGDIISFITDKTKELSAKQYGEEAGFIKRIIALPKETIEIRDGFVLVNGVRLKEPYTARAKSTFGGTVIPDCDKITIPTGKLFVLGDNRVASLDSRFELGFVDISSVDHVLSYSDQKIYSAKWRDPSHDDDLVSQPTLDASSYIKLLNDKREESDLHLLTYQSLLSESARKRGEVMLRDNDLSFEATRSGYTMERAMGDVGYSNITWGEAPILGYYTAEELIENSFQFPESKKFLLNKDFQEVGVSAVLGQINGCPTQVVVQHFAGYVPPNYGKDVVASWKSALASLKSIRPGWSSLRDNTSFYQKNKAEVDQMMQVVDARIASMEKIVSRMTKNQWLTHEEQRLSDDDIRLSREQERLAKSLNSK